MKFSWLSNAPWAPTGYGNQTKLFVPRLKDAGHDPAVIAFWGLQGAVLNWNGIPCYPVGFHPYGQDIMSAHTLQFGAQVMFSLMDAWVFNPGQVLPPVKWIPWFPVDMEPLPPPIKRSVEKAWKRLVFSRFGERMTTEAGLDCEYIPHGVDTKGFYPMDKAEARLKLSWPQDQFVVGMVAANKGNPSRKAFSYQLEAFAQFHRRHPDTALYLHTMKAVAGEGQGMNLVELVEYLGIADCVQFSDQHALMLGFPDNIMNWLYNAMDVHMLVSMGEGFGIPILEAQAAGTPVITGDWTSMSELTFSGWKVARKDADAWWTPLAAYQFVPRVGAIVDALEQAYKYSGKPVFSDRARAGALEYDADLVTQKYWLPYLAKIEQELEANAAALKIMQGVEV